MDLIQILIQAKQKAVMRAYGDVYRLLGDAMEAARHAGATSYQHPVLAALSRARQVAQQQQPQELKQALKDAEMAAKSHSGEAIAIMESTREELRAQIKAQIRQHFRTRRMAEGESMKGRYADLVRRLMKEVGGTVTDVRDDRIVIRTPGRAVDTWNQLMPFDKDSITSIATARLYNIRMGGNQIVISDDRLGSGKESRMAEYGKKFTTTQNLLTHYGAKWEDVVQHPSGRIGLKNRQTGMWDWYSGDGTSEGWIQSGSTRSKSGR